MRIVRRGILGATGLLLAMGGAGLVASHTFAARSHGTASLKIVNASGGKFAFSPKTITVSKGTTLVWNDGTAVPHTITANTGAFNKSINPGKSVRVTLSNAGTYTYHCLIHPYMTGKIVVH